MAAVETAAAVADTAVGAADGIAIRLPSARRVSIHVIDKGKAAHVHLKSLGCARSSAG